MERKATGSSVEVVAEVKSALARRAGTLTGEEERAVRMRQGVSVNVEAPLARAAGKNAELEDELLLIEMQLLRSRMRAGKAEGLPRAPRAAAPAAQPASPTKSKIVRALRRKR